MSALEDAARAYVQARWNNEEAESKDWMPRLAEVDRTYFELVKAVLAPSREKP